MSHIIRFGSQVSDFQGKASRSTPPSQKVSPIAKDVGETLPGTRRTSLFPSLFPGQPPNVVNNFS